MSSANHVAIVRKAHGFTLVELVVAITISSLLVGIVAMTSTAPVDRYLEQNRRADAMKSSDRVVFKMTDDLQHALPNSVRRGRFANTDVLQLLDVHSVAYYQPATGANSNSLLQIGHAGAGDTFAAYGHFNISPIWLAVGNQGLPGFDAYELGRVMTRAPVPTTPALGPKNVTLDPSFFFATASPTNRIFAVRAPVTYICDRQAGTLTRFDNHAVDSGIPVTGADAQLNTAGTSSTVIATGLTSCRVDCTTLVGSNFTCLSAVAIELHFQRGVPPDDENVTLFHQFVVDNTP